MNNLILEKAAASFRTDHGINSAEPIRLKSLLQRLNVITTFSPLSENFSGMAIKAKQDSRFMMINSKQSLGKQHFTICHELYHLYIQADFSSQVCQTGKFDKTDKEEYNADVFASHLLLPKEGLLENIPNKEIEKKHISLHTILYLEHLYSCSRRALLYRLKKLNLLKSEEYNGFTVNIKKGALENGFCLDLYSHGNNNLVIGDYGTISNQLYQSEMISESHYYSLLTDIGIDVNKISNEQDEAE